MNTCPHPSPRQPGSGGGMLLHGTALLAREVFQTAACRVERIVDGDASMPMHPLDLGLFAMRLFFRVLRPSMQRRLVADDDWRGAGHRHLDADVHVPASTTMAMRDLDEHAASHDAPVELLEPAH